ncbi:HlyD family secretion protein [Leptospira broomii serovar Hurstbridge str. 5399]|uniref:HlyD family secretion protein n=1 Tax=Leptospira broomii serovar Hurstbridge str. 5399 TaxID=1049789 RepID=T0F727_9LEPT|nr:HlyD family efflux transporter periplasmic adaptor subunit [Leptospira broomii]EQA43711.1 HlyD family secretion protein [Leptospira broomii serovar Hurstbridge str. 5399]
MNLKETALSIYHNKKTRIALAVVLLILIAWSFLRPKPVVSEKAAVRRGNYEQIVEEEGTTRVKEKFTLYSPVTGILLRVDKHIGDRVAKGDTVAVVKWDYDRKVLAPISGTILAIQRESEGPISMGAPILDIGNTKNLEISCELLTQDSVHVHPGDPVQINGWGGDSIPGKVRLIEPSAFTKISSLGVEEQRVRVIIDFASPPEMGDSFKIKAKIISFRKENVLILPSAALFRDGEDWAVFQVLKRKAKKVHVQIGARSGKSSLLLSGLKDGDEVILYPNEEIREGVIVE